MELKSEEKGKELSCRSKIPLNPSRIRYGTGSFTKWETGKGEGDDTNVVSLLRHSVESCPALDTRNEIQGNGISLHKCKWH